MTPYWGTNVQMKNPVFRDAALYNPVDTGRRLRSAYCRHYQGIAKWRKIPEDSHLYTRRCENVKSHSDFTDC
jgi:hypothetical protein